MNYLIQNDNLIIGLSGLIIQLTILFPMIAEAVEVIS